MKDATEAGVIGTRDVELSGGGWLLSEERVNDGPRVIVVGVSHRADEGKFVGVSSNAGDEFSESEAGDAGLDGGEFGADAEGGLGFEIPEVWLRGSATEEDVDAVFGAGVACEGDLACGLALVQQSGE